MHSWIGTQGLLHAKHVSYIPHLQLLGFCWFVCLFLDKSGITGMYYLVGLKKVLLEQLDIYMQTRKKAGMEERMQGEREYIHKKIN